MKVQYLIILIFLFGCNTQENPIIYSEIKNPETDKPIQLSKKLIESNVDLRKLNLSDLRLLRNEIYARKGYVFKSKELSLHFQKFQWYRPKYEGKEIDNYLTEIDKSNINWIVDIENFVRPEKLLEEMKKSLRFVDFLEILPEIELPTNIENWTFRKKEQDLRQNKRYIALCEKYEKYRSAIGKISLPDSLFAIGINHASDFYTYTTFLFVNLEGEELWRKQLPLSFSSTAEFQGEPDPEIKDTVIERYNDVIITEDLQMKVSSWTKAIEHDSLGNFIKSEFSDTTVVIRDFYKE
ncbi:YARHG domain-containing protein [Carboxylicivirga marina]|uniref:YARHG domain-containing protein n=1 Tax=Carboxylicivirga marina TaxID=2800988 RepID=A0ABS1HQW0_9BACT|nr:YARHG domain-containing protein [Carboxylicivirga marina]MBK3520047.1 YARHG domain-containing protein [Carboxylicivirga marina]